MFTSYFFRLGPFVGWTGDALKEVKTIIPLLLFGQWI
jgi:hypothetical protein